MKIWIIVEIILKFVPVRDTEEIAQVEQQGTMRELC